MFGEIKGGGDFIGRQQPLVQRPVRCSENKDNSDDSTTNTCPPAKSMEVGFITEDNINQ